MSKETYRVRNWKDYNKALQQRGSLTLWVTEDALQQWYQRRTSESKKGRPVFYSDVAIKTCLIARQLFRLPLRQTQGLVCSLFELMGISLLVPSYTQICRRSQELELGLSHQVRGKIHVVIDGTGLKVFGEGEWKVKQHGWTKRRMWKKLHIGIDVASQEIVMMELTDNKVGENKKLPDLLEQYREGYETVGGDKGYDSYDCHELIGEYGGISAINLQSSAKERNKLGKGKRWVRDDIVRRIAEIGKKAWKEEVGYHARSLVETTMYRYKQSFGSHLKARCLKNQQTEALIGCNILNVFTQLGMPESYKVN